MDKLPQTDDPFELLGVAEDCGQRELKRAYTRLIKIFRPDRHPEDFKKIREAFEIARSYLDNPWYQAENETGEEVSRNEDGAILVKFSPAAQEETEEPEKEAPAELPLLDPEVQTEIPEALDYPEVAETVIPDPHALKDQAEPLPIDSPLPEKDPDSRRMPEEDAPDSLSFEMDSDTFPEPIIHEAEQVDMGSFQNAVPDLQEQDPVKTDGNLSRDRSDQPLEPMAYSGDWEELRQKLEAKMMRGSTREIIYRKGMEAVERVADPFEFLVIIWDTGLRNGIDMMAYSERVDDTLLDVLWRRGVLTWSVLRNQKDLVFAGALFREGLERNVIHQKEAESLKELLDSKFQEDIGANPDLEPLLYRVLLLLCWHAPVEVKRVFRRFPPHPRDNHLTLVWLESALPVVDDWQRLQGEATISHDLATFLNHGTLNTETGKAFVKKTITELLSHPRILCDNLELLTRESPGLVEHMKELAAHWQGDLPAEKDSGSVRDIWILTNLQELNCRLRKHPLNRLRIWLIMVPFIFLLVSFFVLGYGGFGFLILLILFYRKFPSWSSKKIYRSIFRPFILKRFFADRISPKDLMVQIGNGGSEMGVEMTEYTDAMTADALLITLWELYQMERQVKRPESPEIIPVKLSFPNLDATHFGAEKNNPERDLLLSRGTGVDFQWEELLSHLSLGPGFKQLIEFCVEPNSEGREVLESACEDLARDPQSWVLALELLKRQKPSLFKRLKKLISVWADAGKQQHRAFGELGSDPIQKQINVMLYRWDQFLKSKAFSQFTVIGFYLILCLTIHMWIDGFWFHIGVFGASILGFLGGHFGAMRWHYRKVIRPSLIKELNSLGTDLEHLGDFATRKKAVFPRFFPYLKFLRRDRVLGLLASIFQLRLNRDSQT